MFVYTILIMCNRLQMIMQIKVDDPSVLCGDYLQSEVNRMKEEKEKLSHSGSVDIVHIFDT